MATSHSSETTDKQAAAQRLHAEAEKAAAHAEAVKQALRVAKSVLKKAKKLAKSSKKAAKQARELLAMAPDEELVVKTYALVGFCQSGYSRETEELRTSLRRLGITDICPAGVQK